MRTLWVSPVANDNIDEGVDPSWNGINVSDWNGINDDDWNAADLEAIEAQFEAGPVSDALLDLVHTRYD